jgi:hypothetical protein
MPPSTIRNIQPVVEAAKALGETAMRADETITKALRWTDIWNSFYNMEQVDRAVCRTAAR